MKQRFLVVVAFTVTAAAGWALWVNACDQDNKTTAASNKGRVSAVTANAKGSCAGMSATTASMSGHDGCASKGVSATTASNGGHDGCAAKGVSATTASNAGRDGCCAMKGASAVTASNAGHDGCGAKGASTAMARDLCSIGAGMIGAPSCAHHGTAVASEMNCDACSQMVECAGALTANATQTQIVPLKNGVMFVYTTDTRAHARAVQNAVARRNDRLNSLAGSGDHAKLCPECKNVRGAIASGKLVRETVNTEGGCLTLVTSSDPSLVTRLRALASAGGATAGNRTKS